MSVDSPGARSSLGECAAAWAVARRTTAGGWNVRYREAGKGPTVVLVHGLGVSADYWWRNGPAIAAAGYRVLAPDLPGFGRTEGPDEGPTVLQQTQSLLAWADSLQLEPAVYAGHSLSCQVAIEVAALHPERVAGLVLAAPTGDPAPRRLTRQAWGLLLDIPREPLPLAVFVAQAYLRAGPLKVWQTWKRGGLHNPLDLLHRVAAPGVVIVGRSDPVVRPEFAEEIAAALPAGRVVWIDGGAHAVIFRPAEAFNLAVLEFLRRVKSEE